MNRDRVEIRRAAKADWPAIRALLQSCQLPLDGAERHVETFVVATKGTRIIGCAGIERHADEALLRSCAVDQEHRGQHIGGALTERAIALAKDLGLRQLVLFTTTAENYFPRFGFTRITREQMPDSLQDSEESRGACPGARAPARPGRRCASR